MITLERAAWQTKIRNAEFHGLSTDDKPNDKSIGNGSTFYEIDTGDTYRFDKENNQWLKQP